MTLRFWKMTAAGNDFVLVPARGGRPPMPWPRLARLLCDRRGGVGADGLLAVRAGAVPRLDYYNADGSAAFCGNGTRCAVHWLSRQGLARGRAIVLDSAAGRIETRVQAGGTIAVRMPAPRGLRLGVRVRAAGRALTAHWVDTGAPHAVVLVRGLDSFPVVEAGRALRRHRAFGPAGTNVDFLEKTPRGFAIRTFERGVEDETPACGTGAVAAALVAHSLGLARPPVPVAVRGGAVLKADWRTRGSSAGEVWLEGPARIVFTGEVEL